jgi:peptide-methionine (S)-S-oxide reductase
MPKEKVKTEETAIFGGGCFWSIKTIFKKLRGVKSVTPGYAGGKKKIRPTEEVIWDKNKNLAASAGFLFLRDTKNRFF